MGGTFMFARAGGRNFACRLRDAPLGAASSATLCASLLAFVCATVLGLVVATGGLGASTTGALSGVSGLIRTTGGLEDFRSAMAVDGVCAVSVDEPAGIPFAPSLASRAAVDASDGTAAWRCATGAASAVLCSGFGSVCFVTDSAVRAGASIDRRPT